MSLPAPTPLRDWLRVVLVTLAVLIATPSLLGPLAVADPLPHLGNNVVFAALTVLLYRPLFRRTW